MKNIFYLLLSSFMISFLTLNCSPKKFGEFENGSNIGQISLAGSAHFDSNTKQYQITGSGENIWNSKDAFYFLWKQQSGDLRLSTKVAWPDSEGHNHRKAGWMIRENLDADAAYVDAVVHGDGLISLQYRKEKGGMTYEIQSPIKAPTSVALERHSNLFTLSVGQTDDLFQPAGSIMINMKDSVFAGLVVCSHDSTELETAIFSQVEIENPGIIHDSLRILESTIERVNITTKKRQIVHRVKSHIEAPNWSKDGNTLIYNILGKLYSLHVMGGTPNLIPTGIADQCNNDHGFSPDGKYLAISHNTLNKGSLIYIIPSEGGKPRIITKQGPSYWHGWSPDGKSLAYCAQRDGEYDVYIIPVKGEKEKRLTSAPGLDDGPDYTPDGKYIYFNSERTGLMKIWRMRADGSNQEQVTFDQDFADWFPHPSPDGKWLVFLSYDQSVKGHPPNKNVVLRIMPIDGSKSEILVHLFGGQGTINVPSWSPDSKEIAFVSYRFIKI